MKLAVPVSTSNDEARPKAQLKMIEDLNPIDFAKYHQKLLRSSKKSPALDSTTNQPAQTRNLQPGSYPYHSQSLLTMKAQLEQLTQQDRGGSVLVPDSASNPLLVRDLAQENHAQDTQLTSQKAPNVINVHR